MKKKWFVYVQDHHEGPFNIPEILDLKNKRLVNEESFVWCEGMQDWQVLTQVTELHSELKLLQSQAPPSGAMGSEFSPPPVQTPRPLPSTPIKSYPTQNTRTGIRTLPKRSSKKGFWGLIIFLLLVVGGGFSGLVFLSRSQNEDLHQKLRPWFSKVLGLAPSLQGTIRMVPELGDVSEADRIRMEDAISSSVQSGVKIVAALSRQDPNRPFFYVATNLPSGVKLEISVVGNGETLLNRLGFFGQVSAETVNGFGKSDAILGDGGQPIPKGEYKVYLSETAEQSDPVKEALALLPQTRAPVQSLQVPQGTRFLFEESAFMGGERDEAYLTRLKAFHEKIKETAEKELVELRQYSQTLAGQLAELESTFKAYYSSKRPMPYQKTNYMRALSQWQQISTQLETTMQTWGSETLKNEFFYGKIYEIVKGLNDSIKKLALLQSEFINKPSDRNSFEIQMGQASSEAREGANLLETKIKLVTEAPRTPTGLPTKEGL